MWEWLDPYKLNFTTCYSITRHSHEIRSDALRYSRSREETRLERLGDVNPVPHVRDTERTQMKDVVTKRVEWRYYRRIRRNLNTQQIWVPVLTVTDTPSGSSGGSRKRSNESKCLKRVSTQKHKYLIYRKTGRRETTRNSYSMSRKRG